MLIFLRIFVGLRNASQVYFVLQTLQILLRNHGNKLFLIIIIFLQKKSRIKAFLARLKTTFLRHECPFFLNWS